MYCTSPYFYHVRQSAIESLLGASMTGVAYSIFAGQPLTILGSTGPVLVFEKILFKFCKYVLNQPLWPLVGGKGVFVTYLSSLPWHLFC